MRYKMKILRLLAAASAAFFIAGTAFAQQGGTVTQNAFVIGKGPGSTSFISLLCGSAQLAVGQSAAAPICRTLTGDVTLTAAGVTAIGANKVLDTMLRQGAARSVIGVTGNAGANVADIQGATDQILRVNGAGTALAFGSIDLSKSGAVGTSILPAPNGGTGLSTFAIGDLLYAATATTLARLADIATGNVLRSGGVGVAPAWGKVALGTDVSGTLAATNFPALTGDVTTVAGALATTLATVNANVGSFGGVSAVPNFTVNAKGLITAAGSAAYQDGTNAAKGVVRGDGTTITCVAGVCTAVGATATSITVGTTTIGSPAGNGPLTSNSSVLGNVLWGQLPGIASNTAASAGNVGEYVASSVLRASAVSYGATNTPVNVTSVSLTAGDWMCYGNGMPVSAATTNVTDFRLWISSTSATLPTAPAYVSWAGSITGPDTAIAGPNIAVLPIHFLLNATTTIYLSSQSGYTVSTNAAYGSINCHRIR
jgi:hypothetical protein